MKHGLHVGNLSRFACLIMTVFCILFSRDKVSAQSAMKTSNSRLDADSPKLSKPHYILHIENLEQQGHIEKCIAKYPYWNKHRMLTRRRVIEVASPHAATIELYSATELQNLYGKRILPGITDHDSDYYKIIFEVTPSGFKEVIVGSKIK